MLKVSLIALFVAIMTTLAIAASAMPVPPPAGAAEVLVAELG